MATGVLHRDVSSALKLLFLIAYFALHWGAMLPNNGDATTDPIILVGSIMLLIITSRILARCRGLLNRQKQMSGQSSKHDPRGNTTREGGVFESKHGGREEDGAEVEVPEFADAARRMARWAELFALRDQFRGAQREAACDGYG